MDAAEGARGVALRKDIAALLSSKFDNLAYIYASVGTKVTIFTPPDCSCATERLINAQRTRFDRIYPSATIAVRIADPRYFDPPHCHDARVEE